MLAKTPIKHKKVTKEQAIIELNRVVESFDYFCDHYCYIQDKELRQPVLFKRFQCQRLASQRMVRGEWLIFLKARQLGITWLSAAFCFWSMLTKPMFTASVIAQNKDYARGFLKRIKFMYQRLPNWLRVPIASDSRYEISLNHGPGSESELMVIAGGDAAGRSVTGDLIVFDEHAFIPDAKDTRMGCEPTLEVSGGQAIIISTSKGPYEDFYEMWASAPENGYQPVFMPWHARPGRTQEWYEEKKKQHRHNPVFMAREYPETPDEAFMYSEGRCFPSFDPKRHVREWKDLPWRKTEAELYRCVDFGHSAPFACLWVAHWPAAHTGLTVEPSCTNTVREFLAYHYDDTGNVGKRDRPASKQDDHTCDAFRYLVVSYGLQGHVHIYRELYIPNSAAAGRTDMDDIQDIHRLSGWVEADPHEPMRFKPSPAAEQFHATVTDPSLGKTIELYNENDVECHGYVRPKDMTSSDQVVDGIRMVNLLIDGTRTITKAMILNEDQLREKRILQESPRLIGVGDSDLQEAAHREAARITLQRRKQERQRRAAGYTARYNPFGL